MALTDVAIRKAAPAEKPYKLSDGRGLYLLVTAKGAKSWRFKYRFGGKELLLTFGLYPEVKLAEARERTDDARAALRAGRDPGAKVASAEPFETIARDWHGRNRKRWSPHHGDDVLGSLEAEVFPAFGSTPINEVTVADVARALRKVEKRGAVETAHRVRQRIDAVFAYGIAQGVVDRNPGAMAKGGMAAKPKGGKQAALTGLDDARQMLADALAQPAHPVTREALLFLALTAVRPGEMRHAVWSEVDDDAALWTIPAARMKGDAGRKAGDPHLVPLAPAAVECLARLRPLTGTGALIFPSLRHSHKPLSENAVGYLLNRAGYHGRQTAHGFRSTFSTIMNERHPADRAIIDLMLAHKPANEIEAAYNRALHMDRRRELATEWAALLT